MDGAWIPLWSRSAPRTTAPSAACSGVCCAVGEHSSRASGACVKCWGDRGGRGEQTGTYPLQRDSSRVERRFVCCLSRYCEYVLSQHRTLPCRRWSSRGATHAMLFEPCFSIHYSHPSLDLLRPLPCRRQALDRGAAYTVLFKPVPYILHILYILIRLPVPPPCPAGARRWTVVLRWSVPTRLPRGTTRTTWRRRCCSTSCVGMCRGEEGG
jgi:hypothetical protein